MFEKDLYVTSPGGWVPREGHSAGDGPQWPLGPRAPGGPEGPRGVIGACLLTGGQVHLSMYAHTVAWGRRPRLAPELSFRSPECGMFCRHLAEKLEPRSEEHTSELQSPGDLVCRLLLEKKKNTKHTYTSQKSTTKTGHDGAARDAM